jgi:hypothetical protein
MLTKLSNWFYRISTNPVTMITVLVFVLFTALVLPGQSSQAEDSSSGAGTPDLSFAYTPADLYRWADAYGEAGRVEYVRARFSFDIAWPLIYGVFLLTTTSWLFGRAFPENSRWRLANLAPLLAVYFDFLENVSTSLVMYRYPTPTYIIDWLASLFTPVKWIMVGGSFGLLLVGLLGWLWQKVRPNN